MMTIRHGGAKSRRRSKRPRQPRQLRGRDSRWRRPFWEVLEDRRLLAGDISWANLATDLQTSLTSVQSNLTTAINYAPAIPIVGDHLATNPAIGQIVSASGNRIASVFQGLPGVISQQYPNSPPTTTQLVDLVKQQLVSVAGDLTANQQITTDDVLVTPNVGGGSAWRFEMLVHQDLTLATVHPQFKAALGNYLTFDTSGSVDFNVGMDYLLQFTFDTANNTLALEPTSLSAQFPGNNQLPNAPLAVEFTAAPSAGFSASGRIAGLLHVTATDNGSHLSGTFAATVGSTGQVTGSLMASSHVGLHLVMNFGDGNLPFNPQVNSDFQFDWKQQPSVVLVSGMDPASFGELQFVKFESISLVADSLFGSDGFVSNIVKKVQAFTKPIQPLIDFISFQVPGLSDLGLDVSVKSFLEEANPGSSAAIEATINAIDAINHINLSGLEGNFPLGSLALGDLANLRRLQNTTWTGTPILTANSLSGQLGPLDFPIITNTDATKSAVQLLLGGDATLFSFSQGFSAEFNLPEIPLFGIPPFLGFFLRPKAAFNLSFSFGYDTAGLRAAVSDADASHFQDHILDGFYIDNTKTHVHDDNGNDYDHYATSIDIIGELDLVARAVILEVSGGLAAQVNLHVDPNLNDGQQRVRLSALDQAISQGQIPFAASGSIYVTADIAVVIPTFWGNIVLAHVNLGHLTIVDFGADGHPAPEDDGNTIFVQKTDASRKVYVRMATLSTPTADDPRAFTKAILVEYPDLKEYYPVARYTHDENGVLRPPEHIRDYNLIATKQAYHIVFVNLVPHYVPYDETGDQTIIVEDLTWDGQLAPVNAVLIGGAGNDTLEYQGAGKAILIGAGGDDILQSTNPNAASVAEFGDRIAANQTGYYESGWPAEVQNGIDAKIEADGQSPIVHGDRGDFMSGAGPHVVLAGGSGANLLEGGTSTTFLGGSGANEYKVSLKLSAVNPAEGHIIVGQSAHNTVIFERTDVPHNDDDSVVLRALGGNLHVTGKETDIVVDHTDTVSFMLNGGTLDIGDLSSLGTVHLLANLLPSRTTVTHVLMDTPLTPQAYPIFLLEHSFAQLDADGNLIFDEHGNFALYYDLDVLQGGSADQAGANLEMVGLAPSDDLHLTLHGGQVKVGNLGGTGIGRVVIDGTVRAANSTFVDDIQIQLHNGNDSMFPDVGGSTTVLMADAMPPYRVQILGNQVQDITRFTQEIVTGNGVNPVEGKLLTIDASQLSGQLDVNSFENMLLTDVNPQLVVSIAGSNNFPNSGEATHVTIGDGLLGNIQSIVHVSSAELTIDNKNAQGAPSFLNAYSGSSRLILTDTTFSGWPGPFSVVHAPMLTYDHLQGPLTVYMGQLDEISLDGTPPGITRIAINSNWFSYRDAVYSANWSVPIDVSGDFGIYLGQRLNPLTGVVERIKNLGGLAIPVTYYAAGLPAVEVVLDGDLDPPDANYILDGDTNLHVVNQEMGLSVTINGFRIQDQLQLLMPGGNVQADLTQTGPGTISIDGSARLAGTNASAANSIVVASRGANITLNPSGANNSVLQTFNTLYVLGSMPQDNLTLNVPTQTNVTNTVTIDASQLRGMLHVNAVNPLAQVFSPFGLMTVILEAVNPLLAVFIVGTDPFSGGNTYAAAQTSVKVGASRLARIEGNVTVSKAVLTIDDSASTVHSDMTINATDASGWITDDPVPAIRLAYSNLYRDLTVNAGAGDRFELDHTPQAIDRIVLNDATGAQDQIYSTNWSAPIIANGNWSIYLGSFLHPNGVVDRIKNLVGLAIPVTLNFSGSPTSHVVLDGDADPAGASYLVDGSGNLHIVNQTVGLNVTINGFRAQDQAYIYLPGGTVAADLRHTGPGILYVDGKSRLAGNHPTAPNSISAQVRAGDISLDPVSTNDSVLRAFNTFFVLGSITQDNLQVTASTSFQIAPSQQGFPRTSVGVYTGYFGSYNVVNQPADFYTVLSWPFQPIVNTDRNEPAILVGAAPPAGVNYTDTTLLYRYSGPDPQGLPDAMVPVRIYPLASNPVTIDNNANLDASQLRGSFSFQVAQPDYSAAEALVAAFGVRSALPVENFGQTSVVLSKVNPELSVSITGTTPIESVDYNNLNQFFDFGGGSVIHYAGTLVTVGTAVLADVQGNVAVHQAWLKEVNDRQGAAANNFTLTAGALTGWATPSGAHPTLTFDTLQGDLAVSGSSIDQFDVEGTPTSAPRVTIQNFATSGPAAGVYVMGKSVMPLFVTGNFALTVGRRLNSDGAVTNVGQVSGVYESHNKFNPYDASLSGLFIQQHLFENLQMLNPGGAVLVPGVTYDTYVGGDISRGQHPLPVFFHYTLPGQSTLLFDTANEVITNGLWDNIAFNPQFGFSGITNYNGIAANSNYAGQADLRFLQGDVIYGACIEVFYYGPQEVGSPGFLNKPGPTMLIDNPLASPVHYIANASNADNDVEEILIGGTLGPVTVQGGGVGTRVEVNPLFSLPTTGGLSLFSTDNTYINYTGFPGWSAGNAAGFSLLDTIQADVTVSNATLRIIGDIPLPSSTQDHHVTQPDVELTDSQVTGIAGAPIHFANLIDSSSSLTVLNITAGLDLNVLQLPGLSIQLPAHAASATRVLNTPAGITTALSTLLSASDTTTTAGPVTVLGTTGPLVLGQLLNGVSFIWPVAPGQPVGSMSWFDGMSVPQITIGDQGSLRNIHGAILLTGDAHTNSATLFQIDGSADAARPQVSFVAQSYNQPPYNIIATTFSANISAFTFYEELDNFAPVPIFFGTFYGRAHNVNVYGSANSSYTVNSTPPTMHLYAGAGSTVTDAMAPIDIIGASTVHLLLASFNPIPGLNGPPQVIVGKDPQHPQPINLTVDPAPLGVFPNTPAGRLHLDNAGNGLLALSLNNDSPFQNSDYWKVLFKGTDAHLAVDFGPIIVTDTGAAGTVINAGFQEVDVNGTTGPLQINQAPVTPGGFTSGQIVLGQLGNMQAILGEVDVAANDPAKPSVPVTLNDSADSVGRTVHLQTDSDGNTRIIGLAPGLIKLVGERASLNVRGGTGGNVVQIDNRLLPLTSQFVNIQGGSIADVLVGPDLPNSWQIYDANSIFLNGQIFAAGVGNLRGGAASDIFTVSASGSLTGNLDGGPGIDTLVYDSSAMWHGVPFDLTHGIAPLVGGITSNVEIVPIDMTTGEQTTQAGVAIAPLQLQVLGGLGHFTYSASGLPPGLSLDSQTGLVTGTISESAVSDSPFLVQVSANDGFNSASGSFQWTVLPGLIIADPGTQITDPGIQINLSLQISTVYGLPLTVTAQGLPPGLSINSQTGLISGTIAAGAANGAPYQVTVTATDGTHTASAMFQWNILEHFSIVNPGDIFTPEGVPISVPVQVDNPTHVPLTFYASGLPAYLDINPSTGVISGSIFFYHRAYGQDFVFPVQVFATHGTTTVSTSFNWSTEAGFAPAVPGDQHNRTGDAVFVYAGVANNSSSNPYGHVFSTMVSGLPAGLTFNSSLGQISGTIDDNAGGGSPYHTVIDIVDQTINYAYQISFQWTVVPTILLGNPGDQTTTIGTSIDVAIPIIRNFGLPIVFAATGLPLGLTIDSATGHIHGTLAQQDTSPAHLAITINANDGTHDGHVSFLWNVSSTAANVVQLADRIHGGVVTLTSPAGTTLTASLGNPNYSDPANPTTVYEFPIQAIQFQISGLPVGAAAQLTISPPAGHAWDHYLESGPTPANQSAHWHDFLYQHATDGDNAASTGAEFLPSGQIVLHLVDGGRGDDDLAGNGVINSSNAGGPALLGLSAAITGLPTQTWQPGVPITLGAQLGGAAAAGATFAWRVLPYDYSSGYLTSLYGTSSSMAFTPNVTGSIRIYYVYLTVISQDQQSSVSLSKYFYVFNPSLGYSVPPLAHFDFGALASNITSGESFGGPIIAENTNAYAIADYSGPLSGQITDSGGHQIASLSGAFNNGQFTVPLQVFVNSGTAPATYTISITSGGVSESATFVVHPVTHFVATDNDPIAAGAGQPFDLTLQAEDDRGNVASAYAGSVRLNYTDAGGVHDVGGGLQSAAGGLVTFHHVVLPAQGVYSLQATSADGLVAGAVSITVPLVTRLASTAGDPSTVTVGQSFDFEIVAQDAAGQPVSGYTGILVLTTRGPSGTVLGAAEVVGAADLGRHVFHNLAENAPGAYTLTVSDGVVSSSFALNVVPADPLSAVNTNDDGPGSLRQAILYANSLSGPSHTITFALPPGPQTITLLTPLPAVTNPLTAALDATQNVTVVLSSGASLSNNSSLTLSGAGTLTLRGGLEGPGNLAVSAGSGLTATHIIESALVIGGTSTSFGLVTIAASDASGNPLALAAAMATDATTSSPRLAAPTVASPSAVATAPTASIMAAATTIDPTTEASPIPVADVPTTEASSGFALASNGSSSDTAGLIARQASFEFIGISGLTHSASGKTEWSSSPLTTNVPSTSDAAILHGRQVTDANGTTGFLHRDAVAAAFDDADIREWLGSADTSRPSASDAESTFLADDLLAAIGQQWRN